ncbi:hypothetical protein EBU71_22080, partial [bacterium]|nr:hypothetical protein [Candidatus Elulimicrobium humile]
IILVVLVIPSLEIWVFPWEWSWEHIYFLCAVNTPTLLYFYITSFSLLYMLFAISTGYFKVVAMISGILNLKSSRGWIVTPKFGNKGIFRKLQKPYLIECVIMSYYAVLTGYEFAYKRYIIGSYVALMTLVFLVSSFGDFLL